MKLLLHTCCAPCLIYPLNILKQEGIETWGFFYNPNIHPYGEYIKRYSAIIDYAKEIDLEFIATDGAYPVEDYFRTISFKEERPQRCNICWTLRLKKTADVAKENDFDYFSTTLLVSPYQDQKVLRDIGVKVSQEVGVEFYYKDFREGFRAAHNEAKTKGIYMQKYCGCIYSERERYAKCC
ncbi:MAG: epoxyqueuosine reductase QueH [Candidatus Omnitrophica bacterium]|nr:epoxyqueuosine reductase QueH [Candidatus Omnitrophota bacterium]